MFFDGAKIYNLEKKITFAALLLSLFALFASEAFGVRSYIATDRSQDTLSGVARPQVAAVMDSLYRDSTSMPTKDSSKKKFLDAPIYGKSSDSLVYNVKNKTINMYGQGDVKYEKVGLQADYIKMGTQTKLIEAKGRVDTTLAGRIASPKGGVAPQMGSGSNLGSGSKNSQGYNRPVFKEGDTNYEIDSMVYNMDTRKAFIKGVNTKDGEGFLYGGEIKKMQDNVIHMHNGRYTTCDADCPHFYLQMTKGTVTDKKTVFGPAYMVFEDVPLYFLGLPFGFFPKMSERNSGFIIPEVGEEVIKGFFVRNGGYYFVINDYVDAKLTAGIYTLGSWQINAASNYVKKYKFAGSLNFDYAADVLGEIGSTDYVDQRNLRINWQHRTDPKATPGSSFNASVNFSTSSYNKYNAQNMNDYLNTQSNSSIAYQKSWAGTPFALTINGNLSQEMRDTVYQFNLPALTFNVNRITPFRRKSAVGKERWYEKISFTYNLTAQNNTGRVKERDLFAQKMFDNMTYAAKHTIPMSATFSVLSYLNITPNVGYNERWYFRRINRQWDEDKKAVVAADTTRGFYRVYDYSPSVSMETSLYGMYTVGKNAAVKFWHVMRPSVSFSYNPGFGQFYETIQTNDPTKPYTYSPYASEMYGVPGRERGGNIGFSLNNTLEVKVPSEADTTGFKKFKIFERFNISSSYNLAADSLNLAPFVVSVGAPLPLGKSNNISLQANMSFDPYSVNEKGQRINRFAIRDGKLLRLTSFSTGLSYSFKSKDSKNNPNTSAVNNPQNNRNMQATVEQNKGFFEDSQQGPSQVELAHIAANQYYDFSIPWSLSLNWVFSYNNNGSSISRTNTLGFNGNMNVTPKWAVSFGAGYDFQMKKITPGTVQITRDLHCWQMSFSWVPVGFRQSWSFSIRAKSSMLSDLLKWDKNNSFLDNQYRR